ncbi:MAG: cytochrome c oxidase subunit 3 [Proteobacteria bacterium]|nr:cytochrome c oxidase subunit 3 [Pseudomonadota bacterium]
MSIFRILATKPWERNEASLGDLHGGGELSLPTQKIGLFVFLSVVTVLFGLIAAANVMRMKFGDWQPLTDPQMLWVNTGVLAFSSLALQWASVSARRQNLKGLKIGFFLGGVLAVAFLAGQILVWRNLIDSGHVVLGNSANGFFYMITAIHGLHLLGGLWAWGKSAVRIGRGVEIRELRLGVELCTLYWHFLLLVWLGMFALLLRT